MYCICLIIIFVTANDFLNVIHGYGYVDNASVCLFFLLPRFHSLVVCEYVCVSV